MVERGDKVVLTGGAGFIGSHLVDRLLAESDAEVVVVDDLSSGRLDNLAPWLSDTRFRFVKGDVRDVAAVEAAVAGARAVYHLAARWPAPDAPPGVDDSFTTNVVGTLNVLRAASRACAARVIFASSRDVYGEPVALPVDEGHPLLAITAHGASKAAGEAYCRAFRREVGLEVAILRLGHIYGPRDRDRVIPGWLERAAAGRDLQVVDGEQVVDFLWVGQAVEALLRAAAVEGPLPPINVASGTGTRVVDVARRIVRLTESRSRIKMVPDRNARAGQFVADVSRMEQLLRVAPPLDPLAALASLLPQSGLPAARARYRNGGIGANGLAIGAIGADGVPRPPATPPTPPIAGPETGAWAARAGR